MWSIFRGHQYTGWHKKRELLKNPTKIEEIQEKKLLTNWTITTCLLRDSNPNYQCLKITACRWRPPPRMRSFTATTHFKISRSFVSLRISKFPVLLCHPVCVLHALQNATESHSAEHATHTGWHKRMGNLKCVVAVKECIRGGGWHLQDVIFKHW